MNLPPTIQEMVRLRNLEHADIEGFDIESYTIEVAAEACQLQQERDMAYADQPYAASLVVEAPE